MQIFNGIYASICLFAKQLLLDYTCSDVLTFMKLQETHKIIIDTALLKGGMAKIFVKFKFSIFIEKNVLVMHF